MSKILGGLPPLGHKNGLTVVAAIPCRNNSEPGFQDRYAIVAVDVAEGMVVAALTATVSGGEWDQGRYFYGDPADMDKPIAAAIRQAIEMAKFDA